MAAEVAKQPSYSNVVDGSVVNRAAAELKQAAQPAAEPAAKNMPNHSDSKENVKPVEHNNAHDSDSPDSGSGGGERTKKEKQEKKVEYVPASPPKDNPWLRKSANKSATTSTSSGQQPPATNQSINPPEKSSKTLRSPRNNKVQHGPPAGGHRERPSGGRGRSDKHNVPAPKEDAAKSDKKDSPESKQPPPRKKVYESAPPPKINAWGAKAGAPTPLIAPVVAPIVSADAPVTNDVTAKTDIVKSGDAVNVEKTLVAEVLPTTNAVPPAPPAPPVIPAKATKGRSCFDFDVFQHIRQ